MEIYHCEKHKRIVDNGPEGCNECWAEKYAALKARHAELVDAAWRVVDDHDLESGVSLYKRGEGIFKMGQVLNKNERDEK